MSSSAFQQAANRVVVFTPACDPVTETLFECPYVSGGDSTMPVAKPLTALPLPILDNWKSWVAVTRRCPGRPGVFDPCLGARIATRAVWCALVAVAVSASVKASTIQGINHTDLSINHFSVNGRSGMDIIGPYQGGGGGCCYIAPERWLPSMTVSIDWETGLAGSKGFPGFDDEVKYEAWAQKFRASKRKHSKLVHVPDYTNQEVCGITVHFLPCDDVQVTTSCFSFASPEYPIKHPLKMPEAKSCPQ